MDKNAKQRGKTHIGTSGWHYHHWKGPFYPRGYPDSRLLSYYIKHFHTAEINNTFYRLPSEKAVREWRDAVPAGFIFAVKGSRYISHQKKLKDPEQILPNFTDRIRLLGDKMGPILFQLPPGWHSNLERLGAFLHALPGNVLCAFEFRDPSWFGNRTEEMLSKRGAAFCIYDFEGRQSPRSVTADFVYIRLHGPDGAYSGRYDREQLADWAEFIGQCTEEGKDVYCYFDNDEAGYAALNASELQELVKTG
jgi:uncharacterized protein YecE (DUF72 family)